MNPSRRKVLQLGGSLLSSQALLLTAAPWIQGCSQVPRKDEVTTPLQQSWEKPVNDPQPKQAILPPRTTVAPSLSDELILAPGLSYEVLAAWHDPLNNKGQLFGTNCDYVAFLPIKNKTDEAYLVVNHEAPIPKFVSHYLIKTQRMKAKDQLLAEKKSVGISSFKIKKNNGHWRLVYNDPHNLRIDGTTPIPFDLSTEVAGSNQCIGTLANCAGGVTPWGTVLACEENYHSYYGDVRFDAANKRHVIPSKAYKWDKTNPLPPEHYGWVTELNPLNGSVRKLTGLGRFAHETAATVVAPDGRCVVYLSDDGYDQCFYKFVASWPGSLLEGELFVANIKTGRWLSMDLKKQPKLQKRFRSQIDIQIRTREAAKILGGTPLVHSEDVAIDPHNNDIYLAVNNDLERKTPLGAILKFTEENSDPLATRFTTETFNRAGTNSGYSRPDNITFDKNGGLWMTSGIKAKYIGKGSFAPYGNNGLFYIPTTGQWQGKAFQMASGPIDCEFSGPCFSADGKTLFLSVQHPGGRSSSKKFSSHWPDGGDKIPRSGVITIQGPELEALTT